MGTLELTAMIQSGSQHLQGIRTRGKSKASLTAVLPVLEVSCIIGIRKLSTAHISYLI